MRYILALALLLVSFSASAQVYKCTHAGQVAYQDTPCPAGEQATKVDVGEDPVNDLVGCYDATLRYWGKRAFDDFAVEVRLLPDGYQMRTVAGLNGMYEAPSAFNLRRATRHEMDEVDAVTHMHMRAGLTVQWNQDSDPAPVGIYKGQDRNGRAIYLLYFRNTYGPALKMACP